MGFLIRRGLANLVQALVLSAITFLFFRLLPGDIYSAEVENPQLSQSSLNAMREARGLNKPWTVRYVDWVTSSIRGDFGTSLSYGIPVRTLLAARIRRTIEIAIPAVALSWVLGLALAIAVIRMRMVTSVLEPSAAAAAMIPDVAAVSIVIWLAVWAGVSVGGVWLPLVALTFTLLPVVFLHASSELRHARELEFVRIARSRGIADSRLWLRYELPAAANPLVSLAGLSLSAAIGASFVVEVLTGWPGIGPLFLEAVQARDYPIVQTVLMGLGLALIVSNFIADLVLYRLDPRIRFANAATP